MKRLYVWFTSFYLFIIVMDFQTVISIAVLSTNRNAHVLRKLIYLQIQG